VVVMVFDISNLHVKGREWKVGKGRNRDLLLKDWIGRGGKREGRKRRRKGGEQPEGKGMEGREGEEQGPILLKDWIGRGGKREGRGREGSSLP